MSRKQPKRRAGSLAYIAIAGFFITVIVGGVGFGVASAGSIDDVANAGGFGFSEATHKATTPAQKIHPDGVDDKPAVSERSDLITAAPRNLSAGMQMIDDMERAEQERIAAENAAAIERMAEQKAMQGVGTSAAEASGEPPAAESYEYSLPSVDWSVGHEAFVAEWGARIDAYLAGSALSGYGPVFAEAAWENGVDPRWSPAISNTESSKGAVCFRSCNAWGWGNTGWGDWETAIHAHVAGLARGYGYSITVGAAQMYCPPNWSNWYADTLGQMSMI